MAKQIKKKVETNKVYVSLDQWKSDFLPKKYKEDSLFFLTNSERAQNINSQSSEIIGAGAMSIERIFC